MDFICFLMLMLGKIACRKGPLMAESGELDVTVHGKSAHAGKLS